ncbi:hypothetical protein KY362_03825 [Candidatus Woesearchaeota archaeon]|nr:hypothetical protein [Candidatus Woesearchaeota archaeon]
MLRYRPRIQVLHIEDDKDIVTALKKELVKRQVYVHSAENLKDAEAVLEKCDVDIIVSDGMFPEEPGKENDKCFLKLMETKPKSEIIAWANSTHVHEYCRNNNIESYTKFELTKEHWAKKEREYIEVKVISAEQMADIILNKILDYAEDRIKDLQLMHFYTEPATYFAISMAADMRTAMFEETAGMNFPAMVGYMKDSLMTIYTDFSKDALIAKSIYDKVVEHDFFPTINKEVDIRSKALLDFARSLKTDLSSLSDDDLAQKYSDFCFTLMSMRIYSSLPTTLDHASKLWTKRLNKIIEDKVEPDNQNEVFSLMTTPEQTSYVKEYALAIAKLGAGTEDTAKESAKDIAERFAHINYAFEGTPITEADVKAKIDEKSPEEHRAFLDEHEKDIKEVPKKKAATAAKYGFTDKELTDFSIGADIVWIKFYRKGVFAESYYCAEFLLREIGKRLGLTENHLRNMRPQEVLAALATGEFPAELIDRRIARSAILMEGGQTLALDPKFEESFSPLIIEEDIREIKGQAAFAGTAEGVVRIVNLPSEMSKFEDGDILVSRSTNPSLVPVMEKAAAFVTDLGGLTCHAAIVAREMKKPCIVGTTVATKLLRDGDRVIVDAKKGEVRKLD